METLALILSAPLTNVLIGALVGGGFSLLISLRTIRLQSTAIEIDYLSEIARKLTEILSKFEPAKINDSDNPTGGSKTSLQFYESIREIYFKNEALMPLAQRGRVKPIFVLAEVAYALLAVEDKDGVFINLIISRTADTHGVDANDIAKMNINERRLVLMEFCTVYREALISFLDIIHDNILRNLGKQWAL
ncbi:MAG: hypothetical protein HC850_02415 [Rhodomicrobium sp.]|nr:hypothetical protein [Rhodomicrobium sp.]